MANYGEYWAARVRRQQEVMDDLTYGVEIETAGLGCARAAQVVAAAIPGATVRAVGGYYDKYEAVMPDGRAYGIVTDGSITGGGGAEVVTPILKGEADLVQLQGVVRALRAARAKSDAAHDCGIHVHIGVRQFEAAVVGRVVKVVAKLDGFIRRACGVAAGRGRRWACALTEPTLQNGHVANIARLGQARTMEALGMAWYGNARDLCMARAGDHYHGSRYHALNLHSVFYRHRGTVEFRYFNGTLHAGKIRAYVQLCQAIVAKAVVTAGASAAPARCETRDQAANALVNLGMTAVGDMPDRFKTARLHLLAAWGGRQRADEEEAA